MRQAVPVVKGQLRGLWMSKFVHVMFILCRGAEMAIFRVVAACLLLAGCGAQLAAAYGIPIVPAAQKEQVSRNISVGHDPHTGLIKVSGPLIFHDRNLLGNTYLIRSWIDPKGQSANGDFQILVTGRYPKRVYLKQAYADGEKVSTTVIDRERVSCADFCIIKEAIGLNLTEEEMARRAETGMSFKVLGRRASLVMTIPPAYFAALLDAHRAARSGSTPLPRAVPRSDAIPAGSPAAARPASSPA
ncbi:hypothetical protein ACFFTN_10285 [Aminobacter aganoensis]|uniref:Uncharacterized protein n=2 Tax=Aminobacter aganoensis TaxID=83264 RepID=A0A7X0FB07_9HYPH|nr:hypothetical protein [Aminobacter aganoensis]MBB6356417.1 hypothetical protein [Aminobacter aganoensis]